MKNTFVWLILALALCLLFGVSCSQYEMEDPTGAKIIMLKDQGTQQNSETPDDSVEP